MIDLLYFILQCNLASWKGFYSFSVNGQLVNSIMSGWELTSYFGSRGTLARFRIMGQGKVSCVLPTVFSSLFF